MTPPALSTLGAKLGLAAVVLLAPGGSLVGAALVWRWWRAREARRAE